MTGSRRWLLPLAGISAALGGVIAYGRFAQPQDLPLPDAVTGERREIDRHAGPLSYYVAGSGDPVLLVHSINAAASAQEIEPIFEALRRERRVYALDLPGFGFSDRSARSYDIDLYVSAIADMVDEIAADSGSSTIDALALSLSSEFLARLASERPAAFRTLALVTPTGFERGSSARRGPDRSNREIRGVYASVTVPLWSRGLYNLLVTRTSIRYFLERTYGSKEIDEGEMEYAYLTAHQPGAEHAPFAFLSGRLFSGDIRNVYERLTLPVLVLHGTKGDFQDFSEADWASPRENWDFISFDTGALVHFEQPDLFMQRYRAFLDSAPARPDRIGQASPSSSDSRSPSP